MLVWSEFGRTPKISRGGLDHWPEVGFVLFAGAVKAGQVMGETAGRGQRPKTRAVTAQNVLGTVYHTLGIDWKHKVPDFSGRPVQLLDDGDPITETATRSRNWWSDVMPMHDWTKIPPGIYHDFHGGWLYAIRGALNSGLLPKGYYALADQVTRTFGPDVLTLHIPTAGDTNNGAERKRVVESGGVAVAVARPKAQVEAKEKRVPPRAGQRRLTIRHVSDHQIIALIELVSPSNKASTEGFESFLNKACGVLNEGIHLLVLDPFPPTRRDPNGVHAAIWEAMTEKPFAPPPGKPLTLAAYCSGEEITAFVDPIAVGDTLPDKPLFLNAERYVNVPLEATYMTAWQTFPAGWRDVVAGA